MSVSFKIGVFSSCRLQQRDFVQCLYTTDFLSEFDPTVEDTYRITRDYNGTHYKLEILDAVDNEFGEKTPFKMQAQDGFIVIYTASSRCSFEEIEGIIRQIHEVKDKDVVPIVLVEDKGVNDKYMCVTPEEGKELADKYNIPFVRTETATRKNVELTLETIVHEIENCNPENNNRTTEEKKDKCFVQ